MTFRLDDPLDNGVTCNRRWAVVSTLHFFADTEEAGVLHLYNVRADRFLTGDRWVGAYGAAAMRGIRLCVDRLIAGPSTRRAVVTMPDLRGGNDANRPACWNLLHFLAQEDQLHLMVYQRSLNLDGVYPYDVALLSNVLIYVARKVGVPVGSLVWTVGSLHRPDAPLRPREIAPPIVLPVEILDDPWTCMQALKSPEEYQEVWS